MSEEIKKQDQTTEPVDTGQLQEQDLDTAAGGGAGEGVGGVEVGLRKKKPAGVLNAG